MKFFKEKVRRKCLVSKGWFRYYKSNTLLIYNNKSSYPTPTKCLIFVLTKLFLGRLASSRLEKFKIASVPPLAFKDDSVHNIWCVFAFVLRIHSAGPSVFCLLRSFYHNPKNPWAPHQNVLQGWENI